MIDIRLNLKVLVNEIFFVFGGGEFRYIFLEDLEFCLLGWGEKLGLKVVLIFLFLERELDKLGIFKKLFLLIWLGFLEGFIGFFDIK